jgi:hypothetical protein
MERALAITITDPGQIAVVSPGLARARAVRVTVPFMHDAVACCSAAKQLQNARSYRFFLNLSDVGSGGANNGQT